MKVLFWLGVFDLFIPASKQHTASLHWNVCIWCGELCMAFFFAIFLSLLEECISK
jgi:threonine/homoserine/homoserine lactone efflux protein